jgi:hypothetical protein
LQKDVKIWKEDELVMDADDAWKPTMAVLARTSNNLLELTFVNLLRRKNIVKVK